MTTNNTFQPPVFVNQTKRLPLVDVPKIVYRIGSYLETPNPDSTGGTCKSQYVVFCDVEHDGTSYRVEEVTDKASNVEMLKVGFKNWAEGAITDLVLSAQRFAFSAQRWNGLSGELRLDDKEPILVACDVAQADRAYRNACDTFFGDRAFTAR